jgi:hypothetical protein
VVPSRGVAHAVSTHACITQGEKAHIGQE